MRKKLQEKNAPPPPEPVGLSPLGYIEAVLNDAKFGDKRRDKLAMAALKYKHERPAGHGGVGSTALGKTEQKKQRALDAGARFAARTPPKLVVNNT